MELFKLPRTVGQFEEKDVVASVGRFGPFLRYDGAFYNIGKLDPLEINLEDSIQVIKDKQEAARKALLHDFENDPPVKVIQGRYGPYMTLGKDNYKLPKDIDIDSLTLEKCLEIAENSQPTNKGGKRKTTKAAPKTKAKAKPKAKPKAKK
jgi:DNA topoisomerase-1